MNPSMLVKLEQLAARHEEVGALLAEPDATGDSDRFRALSVEYAQLEPVASGFLVYRQALDDLEEARELARDSDPDPVSYTHLDVYKRQALRRRMRARLSGARSAWYGV